MADSNITKKALAASLKELLQEIQFEKITVGDICNKCEMSRKSFYYHFRDKYDLINWIFNAEFIEVVKKDFKAQNSDISAWDFMSRLCKYFYKNRKFYNKVFQIKGQNSFYEYFKELIKPALEKRLISLFEDDKVNEFQITFYSDAFMCAIERWLSTKNCIPPEQFIVLLKSTVYKSAKVMYKDFEALK